MDRVGALLDRARVATGLDDFGADSFREGLQLLVNSADAEARLNELGRTSFDGQIVDLLSQRLQVEHWYAKHPEIDDQQIVAPLIGLGLPRTGSTALSCLLAEDPAIRFLRSWESSHPCPPPEASSQERDPRIDMAEARMIRRNTLFPRMKQMLPSTATSPTECQLLMGMDFKSQIFQASTRIPSYVAWLNHRADLVPTYRFVKRALKLLQWRCPPTRWRLKNPSNSLFIDALDEVFPDARFWMTHRDVGSVVGSVADLYYELSKVFTDQIDKHWCGAVNIEFCELGMRRMIAFRDAGNDHRFFDVHFAPFMKDPLPIIAGLYRFLGEEFTSEARARMEAWRRNTPREQHGAHSYDPAEFGLDPEQLRERFRFYSERFNVPAAKH